METFYLLSVIIVVVATIVNLAATIAVIVDLKTGSYKRYIEKREHHFEQLRRINAQLKKD